MNGDPRDSIATTWLQNDSGDDNAGRGGDRVDCVLQTVKPALWFYGHYHKHFEGVVQHDDASHDATRQTRYICLDIAEMTRVF